MKKSLSMLSLILLSLVTVSASAMIDRSVVIEGKLKSFDAKMASLEVNGGIVHVPVELIKEHQYQPGQFVSVHVDIVALMSLNQEVLAKAGIK